MHVRNSGKKGPFAGLTPYLGLPLENCSRLGRKNAAFSCTKEAEGRSWSVLSESIQNA